jgi:transposase
VSRTSIANWRDQSLDGGQQAVAAGAPTKPTSREQQLAVENEQLAAALGEAHMELRLWRKGGALYPGSTSSTSNGGAAMTVVAFCERLGIPRPTW